MAKDDEQLERLYVLAERLGRLSGEAHNLMSQLAGKMASARAAIRQTGPPTKPRRARREKPAQEPAEDSDT